jgi:4-carboxymuconolactone decarboxylase
MVLAALTLALVAEAAPLADRLPPIPEEKQTEAQKKASADFAAERNTPVFGPFVPLLRSPELMLRSHRMGEYLRYRSALGLRLSEFVILCVARHWTQQVEWTIHAPIAARNGVKPEIIAALAEGARPAAMAEDEAAAYDLLAELLAHRSVSDGTWARAVARLGEQGTVDLLGLAGYYTMLAMVMNAAHTPATGTTPPLSPFPR